MGFLNYTFGIATFLIELACWFRWHRRWSAATVVAFAALAFACYFSHIASYLFLGLAMAVVCGYEIWTGRAPAAQCAVSLLPGLAPLPAYFLWKHFINQRHRDSICPVGNERIHRAGIRSWPSRSTSPRRS